MSLFTSLPLGTSELLQKSLGYCGACWAVHIALRPVVRRFPIIEPKYRGDWLNRCIAIGHAAVVGFVATRALFVEAPFGGYTQRLLAWDSCQGVDFFAGSSAVLAAYLPLSLGYMVYDLGLMSVDAEVRTPLMVVHHVFSLTLWPVTLLLETHQYYVLQLMSTEATSVLLHLAVFLLPKHGYKGTPLHTACGLALIGAFALLRLVPVPYLLYSLWANRAAFGALSPALQFASCAALPIPMLLNLYWFTLLVKGALKGLGLIGNSKKKRTSSPP